MNLWKPRCQQSSGRSRAAMHWAESILVAVVAITLCDGASCEGGTGGDVAAFVAGSDAGRKRFKRFGGRGNARFSVEVSEVLPLGTPACAASFSISATVRFRPCRSSVMGLKDVRERAESAGRSFSPGLDGTRLDSLAERDLVLS